MRRGRLDQVIKYMVVIICLGGNLWNLVAAPSRSDSTKHWVGTWACAPYRAESNTPPSPGLSNNTLRQIVRVSIGGDTVRVKFSNITCASAITINSVNIARSPDGTKSAVDASTITQLKFNGNAMVTISAKSEVYSDPVAFNLTPSMRLAITTYYGQCQSSADMTFHYGSRTDSYLLSGDKTTSADFGNATKFERWYTISAVEVWASKSAAAVGVIGNSITDGYGLSGGLQNRWTDIFSERLLKNTATQQVAVLNLGIGATLVTSASNGAQSGVDRFKHDILEQSGLHWVIIFYGVNDINGGVSANNIINGFKKMIAATRAMDTSIKVYGSTITPFNGHNYYSPANESVRSQVNAWIRAPGNYDGCIDLDKAIRNPSDTTRLQQAYSNDWLHPSVAGHKAMGESIDLSLFTPPAVKVSHALDAICCVSREDAAMFVNRNTGIAFELPRESFVSVKVYSLLGKETTELAGRTFSPGRHTVNFSCKNWPHGIYVFSIKAGGKVSSLKTVLPMK